jgi:hypothetical protein
MAEKITGLPIVDSTMFISCNLSSILYTFILASPDDLARSPALDSPAKYRSLRTADSSSESPRSTNLLVMFSSDTLVFPSGRAHFTRFA